LLTTGGTQQVLTTDHLRSFIADPVLMTRIAAHHALGDIWAMGAKPQAATANLILPRLSDALMRRTLQEIMTTAREVMSDAGAEIVGGHSSLGDELTIGFSLTGLCDHPPITLSGARPGDILILTKPLGSGVLMAADMQGHAAGEWISQALDLMTQSQSRAADILASAHAMTDVTGFGLAGHLKGLCDASGTGAALRLDAIPLMPGALELAGLGIRSTLYSQNRAAFADWPETPRAQLVFDPQTAGGLLAAVAAGDAAKILDMLKESGYSAAIIGTVTDQPGYLTAV
jgi:selenide,water dikinase